MATLTKENASADVIDGDAIQPAADQLGVRFGCRHGRCGTCKVVVVDGMENLSPKNEAEEGMNLEDNQRLCCQAKIISGTVVIEQS